jgi:hypothetical protein
MMTQNHDVAQQTKTYEGRASGRTKMTIDLPADHVLRDSALIDRMIGLTFDRLGRVAVEVRVRETSAPGESFRR